MATKKRHTAEEIVNKLRQVDVELSKGATIAQACKAIGVTDQTYYRWRREYGGPPAHQPPATPPSAYNSPTLHLQCTLTPSHQRRCGVRRLEAVVESKARRADVFGVDQPAVLTRPADSPRSRMAGRGGT